MILEKGMSMEDIAKGADDHLYLDPKFRNTHYFTTAPKCRACRVGLGVHEPDCSLAGQVEPPRCPRCWVEIGEESKSCLMQVNHLPGGTHDRV